MEFLKHVWRWLTCGDYRWYCRIERQISGEPPRKGLPGVGKSNLIRRICRARGVKLVNHHPAKSDPTDFKGLPVWRTKDGK